MSVVNPDEMEMGKKMWLSEKVMALEKDNKDLKRAIQEMEARIELQGKTMAQIAQRHGEIETAIPKIWEHVQRQDTFNEGVRASFTSVSAEDVEKHQNNFREVVWILQTREEHIIRTGSAFQETEKRINALIQENANKTVWISSPMRDPGTNAGPSATRTWTASPGRSD